MTVVLDYDIGRVVCMGQGRQSATLEAIFRQMLPTARNRIEAVALDMCEPYIQCVKRWCKNADVVFDLFQVVKAFNKVIDHPDVRRDNQEFRKANTTERKTLKRSRYLFLKNWGNLRRDPRVRLEDILAMNRRLNTIYWLKDLLVYIWEYRRVGWTRATLKQWCAVARQDGHSSLVRFARRTLERYQEGLLKHCKHPLHTSRLEGVHHKIKVIKRIAYGYHDPDYFALKLKQAFPDRFTSN